MINSNTNIACLIGSPVSHSLSPIIHNSIYKLTGRNMVYLSFDIAPTKIANFVESVKTLDIKAFNITMPNKEVILEYVNEIVGNHTSINTVRNDNGKLIATSTDSLGFLHLLDKNNIETNGKTILIIGSGSTCEIVIKSINTKNSLSSGSSNIILAGRTEEKIKSIAKKESTDYIALKNIDNISDIDIVINTTPLGMHSYKYDFDNFNFLKNICSNGFVIDCIYNPWSTNLLKNADKLGLNICNGIDMLLGQAFASHTFWFDEKLESYITNQVYNTIASQKMPS